VTSLGGQKERALHPPRRARSANKHAYSLQETAPAGLGERPIAAGSLMQLIKHLNERREVTPSDGPYRRIELIVGFTAGCGRP